MDEENRNRQGIDWEDTAEELSRRMEQDSRRYPRGFFQEEEYR